MTLETAFSVRHKHFVTLHHEELGEVGSGTLSFGKGKWAHVDFQLSSLPALTDGATYPRLVAQTPSGDVFTLFGFTYRVFYAHIDLVAEGEVNAAFPRIFVRYSEASEWFLGRQHLEGEVGETLTWANKPEPIDVHIRTDTEHFSLKTSVVGRYTHTGEDHSISEHVLFTFERLDGLFGYRDVAVFCRHLSNFLSVLIAQSVNIVSVGLGDGAGFHYACFPHFKRKARKGNDGSWTRWLIQRQQIDGRWQSILERYYSSEFREVDWGRLAGMQRYEGFWEFRTFGYISMLDGLVQKKARHRQAGRVPPSDRRMRKFKRALARLPEPLTAEQQHHLSDLAVEVFSENEERSFAWCYRHACADSDEAVLSVINISEADFSIIKNVRNAIAHGGEYNLSTYPIERLSILVSKITLLLTYWAYDDFGLTADDFLRCLHNTHNRLVPGADIDRASLDRILGAASFFQVSEQSFNEIEANHTRRMDACFVRDDEGDIRFSEKHARMIRDWRASRSYGVVDNADIFGVEAAHVSYHNTAYVECGKRQLTIYAMYLIDETGGRPRG